MPTIDMSDCPCCGGGGCCCGLTQADTLILTFTGGTGAGACLAGKTYTLSGVLMGPASYQWNAPSGAASCLGQPNFSVLGISCSCIGGVTSGWSFYVGTTGPFMSELSAPANVVCSPLSITGTVNTFSDPFGNPIAGTADYEIVHA